MSKYQNSKIYKIVCNTTGQIYIGSTYLTLEERLKKHEQNYRLYMRGKWMYGSSNEIIKNGNYNIELIKNFPCKNQKELHREEGLHQLEAMADENIDCVNKHIAGRTHKEYCETYREQRLSYGREWYIKSAREKRKTEKFTCDCGSTIRKADKNKHFKTTKHKNYLASLSSSSSSSFQSSGRK